MKNSHKIALSLGLLALPVITYAGETTELEKLQQEIKALQLENQSLRDNSVLKDTGTFDINSTAKRNLEPVQIEPARPAWKPEWMKDISVSLGTKIWINKWDGFVRNNDKTTFTLPGAVIQNRLTNTSLNITAEESVTPIPSLNIRYKKIFAAASFYPETEFTFESVRQTTLLGVTQSNGPIVVGLANLTETTAKRAEWDFSLGYSLTPNIAFLTGYKSVRQKFHTNTIQIVADESNAVTLGQEKQDFVYDVSGPLLGISLAAPLSHGFGSYFNYLHGFMTVATTDSKGANVEVDGDYDLMEGGIAYSFSGEMLPAGVPLSSAALFAGYRYQWIESSGQLGGSDVTQGFATGINLTF